jgi:predicted phage tail protein
MKKILLRGELGKKFGRVHFFDLNTPAEAIRALSANFENFALELAEAGQRGIGYMVQVGRDAMADIEEINNPTGQAEAISITPVLQGAGGGGLGRIFAGVALVAAAVVLGPIGIGLFSAGTGVATTIGAIGASLILGGTSQLLSPSISETPGTFGTSSPTRQRARDSFTPENNEIADNRASYIFNGAVNLTAQGNPVPLCYGRMVVGSVVVSAGLSVEDI